MRIKLNAHWLAIGRAEGEARFWDGKVRGKLGYLGRDAALPDAEMLARHKAAAIAEICINQVTGWPWKSQVGCYDDRADVGPHIEVRYRRIDGGGLDLGIRMRDLENKAFRPFVLVHRYAENDNAAIGWLTGCDAAACGAWNETIEGWYVARSALHDVLSLIKQWGKA